MREASLDLPSGWATVQLKYVADLRSGSTITSDDIETDGAIPVFGGNGLRGFTHDFTHVGDHVLIGRQGALCGNINIARGRFWASEHAVVVTPRIEAPTTWLALLLQSLNLGEYSQSAAQPGLAVEVIGRLKIPIPPAEDRRNIADFLDRETAQIDATIDAQQRLLDLLVERRTSVVLRSVMNRDDVSWRGQLGRILTKLDRSVEGNSEVVTAYRDGVVVRRSERRDDGYTFSDLEQGYQGVKAGDLVFHGLDGFAGAVGVARSGGKCSPVYHVCTATARADNRFIGHLLRSYGHIGLLAAHAWSVRQRSVDYRNWKQLAALPIGLPSYLDQLRTVESLETELAGIDRLSERVNVSVALLRERRAALITAAVTGRLDPRTGVERLDDIMAGAAS